MRVAIIGAGIGGLTLAIAMRARGMEPQVYEQAEQLSEIGAAVALSANGTRELERLGLGDALHAVSIEPTELVYRDGRTGARVAAHPVRDGGAYRARFGAPYYGIHRADVQRVLGDGLGGAGLNLGHRLVALDDGADAARLTFGNGHVAEADLVVGADGVRSVVRAYVTDGQGTAYSGTSAFRGIVPVGALPSLPDPQAIQFWMGPGAHLLHYAIGVAGDVNYFAVVEGPEVWPAPGSSTADIGPGEAVAAFKGWHPAVTEMVAAGGQAKRWGLFVVPHLLHWHRGRAVLLGDSAHAMVPHHGQGANTTVEDAVTLAALLPGARLSAGGLGDVLPRYQALRRARTRKIQRSAWHTNGVLHRADGPGLAARDAAMRGFPERFGWIHGHDALSEAQAGAAAA